MAPQRASGKVKGKDKDYIHTNIYTNALPEIPFDPKFVDFAFDSERFVKFKATSLEKDAKHELKPEPHMGIYIDLINTDEFQLADTDGTDGHIVEDEKDRALLREDKHLSGQEARRLKLHNQSMTFFHRTQYISSEFKSTNKLKQDDSAPVMDSDPVGSMDVEDEISEIERVFAAANGPVVKHPLKPKLQPVSVWPVYPDFASWGNTYTQVTFDGDPNTSNGTVDDNGVEVPKACESGVLLGMKDTDEQYASFFAPSKSTVHKKHRMLKRTLDEDEDDEGEYTYQFQKDYAWNVLPTNEEEKTVYFSLREDKEAQQFGAYYNFLQAKIKLQSRRKGVHKEVKYERVVVTDREFNAVETVEREERLMMLKGTE